MLMAPVDESYEDWRGWEKDDPGILVPAAVLSESRQ